MKPIESIPNFKANSSHTLWWIGSPKNYLDYPYIILKIENIIYYKANVRLLQICENKSMYKNDYDEISTIMESTSCDDDYVSCKASQP